MRKSLSLITGFISLVIGLLLVTYRVSTIKAGIVTKATVLRINEKWDGETTLYQPVLRFKNNRNEPIDYKPDYRATDWYIGETVKLFYKNDTYEGLSILSYWRTFWAAIIAFCVAFVALLIATGEYLARRFFKTLNYPNAQP